MIRTLAVVLSLAAVISLPGLAERGQTGGGLIRIFAVTSAIRVVDVGRPGQSAGDQRISELVLLDRRTRVIGNGHRVCASLGGNTSLCQAIFNLPRGKLVAIGTRKRRDYFVLPIVGGTRLYSTVQGTLLTSTTDAGPPRHERLLFSLDS